MTLIDLRSDTVTKPTDEMMEAMRRAELGDDGREGDPTVRRLEALAAAKTGKQAALYVPSGTQANLISLLTHTGRGSEVLLHEGAHIISYENYGLAILGNLFYRAIPGRRGAMDLERLEYALASGLSAKGLAATLVCMETTHNNANGAALPLEHMAAVYKLAKQHGANVHTDGARLFNAAAALGATVDKIAQHTDTVCFCVSKGLSAPVGSLLCGTKEFIERARHFRRMVGGNMRQSGLVAAAGIVALEQMTGRLIDDHASAKKLAQGLQQVDASLVDAGEIETNIVRIDVSGSGVPAAQWSADLKGLGIWAGDYGSAQLRFVTHRHVGETEIGAAISAVGTLWQRYSSAAKKHMTFEQTGRFQ